MTFVALKNHNLLKEATKLKTLILKLSHYKDVM